MDWTQSLTIIFSTAGFVLVFFIYLMSRMDNKFAHMDTKFEQILNRMDSKFDTINTRFNGIENRLTSMESEIRNTNQRIDSTNQRINDLKTDITQRLSTIESFVLPRKVLPFEASHHDHHDEPKEN